MTSHPDYSSPIAGDNITFNRCQAISKRSRQGCKAPTLKTEIGQQRCAEAKTIHDRDTREALTDRSLAFARFAVLKAICHMLEFINGPRTRGRQPRKMNQMFSELLGQSEDCSCLV